MKKNFACLFLLGCFLSQTTLSAQDQPVPDFYRPGKSTFWQNVRIGGGLGLAFGDGFANISVAPSGIYQFTEQFAAGVGLQYNYVKSENFFKSTSYGINLLGLYNPIPEIQLSAELEQLRVNNDVYYYNYRNERYNVKDDFWNTALFLGAGYSAGNATIGIRYNVLFNKSNYVYEQAWMPFIRVYF